MPSYEEEDLLAAITAYKRGDCASISRTSRVFNVPRSTLGGRLKNSKSSFKRNINQQILGPIEEETLENWIYRAAKLGTPTFLRLLIILAEEIQKNRNGISAKTTFTPISRRWTERFRARHARIKTCFTRPIDASRLEGTNYSTLKTYFDRLGELLRKNRYPPSAISTSTRLVSLSDLLEGLLPYTTVGLPLRGRGSQDSRSGLRRSSVFPPRG
jgi:hypothetical protein